MGTRLGHVHSVRIPKARITLKRLIFKRNIIRGEMWVYLIWHGRDFHANWLFLDGYHRSVLYLIVLVGVPHDEAQKQEDEERPFRMNDWHRAEYRALVKLTPAWFIYCFQLLQLQWQPLFHPFFPWIVSLRIYYIFISSHGSLCSSRASLDRYLFFFSFLYFDFLSSIASYPVC
mgnify:CR=1 FL=1